FLFPYTTLFRSHIFCLNLKLYLNSPTMSIKKLVLFLLLSAVSVSAQQKITLEEIWGGAFRTQGMQELQAMKNTNEYTVLNRNSIDLYDFATLEKKKTLFSTKAFSIDSYTFDQSENK